MPDLMYREAKTQDWNFINLLNVNELKEHLNALWPYQNDRDQLSRIKRSKFYQCHSKIITYQDVDIGYISMKNTDTELVIEEFVLWYDDDEDEIATSVIEQLIIEPLTSGAQVISKARLNHPQIEVYERLGFRRYLETENRVYLRKII
ncbi:hypothetical protein D5018_17100 [Parashewanella curva]|uniref:N-acetyltransferase n=1 Tax=Parashewanella curva TaxID=2338552 RepID=A0A3L8PVL6_9GAMM|nr:hypothetical protein [Parashewanella curva]RLV58468.1 hypothetical protein D5018_17100 [Parashewanella curva]